MRGPETREKLRAVIAEKMTAETNTEELVQYMVGARDDTGGDGEGVKREVSLPH